MKLWQAAMIALARSDAATRFMQEIAPTSGLAARFMAGAEVADFLAAARSLRGRKLATSAFYLGEYVNDPAKVETNVAGILAAVEAIDGTEVDLHVSVDPSQIGYAIDDAVGRANAFRIGRALVSRETAGRKTLMLDMEDESYVPRTLDLHEWLIAGGVPAAVTIQAYLRRSAGDIERLAQGGAMVRLVKGAFVGTADVAFVKRGDIDGSYRALAAALLSAESRAAGTRPVFATHDETIIAELRAKARADGWPPGSYEFEMLYGVRPALQQKLAEAGEDVRLYLPFGRDWWPYAVRRVGEAPRNAGLVLKALFARR